MTTPDPITPERVTLTEAEHKRLGLGCATPWGLVPAVERILSDRLRAAQADAWDEGAAFVQRNWTGQHGLPPKLADRNPYRETP